MIEKILTKTTLCHKIRRACIEKLGAKGGKKQSFNIAGLWFRIEELCDNGVFNKIRILHLLEEKPDFPIVATSLTFKTSRIKHDWDDYLIAGVLLERLDHYISWNGVGSNGKHIMSQLIEA